MDFFDMRFLSFIGIKRIPEAPWKKYYKNTDMKINLHNENVYTFVKNKAVNHYDEIAINYYGTKL